MIGELTLAPLVPWPLTAVLGLLAAVLVGIGVAHRARGMAWRTLALAALVLALLDPRMVGGKREARPDVAVLVVDRSPSQNIGKRPQETAAAVEWARASLDRFDDLETRIVEVGGGDQGTRLFDALDGALAEVQDRRFAGALVITDGQVHDVPGSSLHGPLHILLTGSQDEKDRRLVVDAMPGFGMVGQSVDIAFRVVDSPEGGATKPATARVVVRVDGGEARSKTVTVGRPDRVTVQLDHAGPTVVELEVEAARRELSMRNNRAVVGINGVRDRLRVLLVSGQPHAGERTWRNLLKSDPSVDLVHFTILRPPEKDDFTPVEELSLIVFPVHELFEVKLHEFDLIVFDRYMVRDVLPPSYFRNIAEYVRRGGALLLAVGPEFAGVRSLFETPLGAIVPGRPSGTIREGGFRPVLTENGRRHPVTAGLPGGPSDGGTWGRWFRYVEAARRTGVTLMNGPNDGPLLILDRIEDGRIALLMSDHIWLWARGFEGGGPQAELLRRLAHWLMKEPDLEEENLTARSRDGQVVVERRSLSEANPPVTLTTPSGENRSVVLKPMGGGRMQAVVPAGEWGLYRADDGKRRALAAVGTINPVEMVDLRASAAHLEPVAAESGGGVAWIADGLPDLRRVRPDRDTAGRGWMGIRRNGAYDITGISEVPVMPALVFLALVLGGLVAAWWREGR